MGSLLSSSHPATQWRVLRAWPYGQALSACTLHAPLAQEATMITSLFSGPTTHAAALIEEWDGSLSYVVVSRISNPEAMPWDEYNWNFDYLIGYGDYNQRVSMDYFHKELAPMELVDPVWRVLAEYMYGDEDFIDDIRF